MEIRENISLKPYNTFGVDVKCAYFAEIHSPEDIQNIRTEKKFKTLPKLILGEGSDILFTRDFDGLILKDSIKNITIVHEDDDFIWIKASSGENWHSFVKYCVNNNWGGLENLALIPGTVGASPVQNIGAYGAELKDSFHSLEYINLETGKTGFMMNEDCRFAYRRSIFKEEAFRNKIYITSVSFQLAKKPVVNLSYPDLIAEMEGKEPTIHNVFEAVCRIREKKLPDPKVLGNAGSFFKNPVVSKEKYYKLAAEFPELKAYETQYAVKLAAAQLIELCGAKKLKENNVGVHEKQALVIVNYGNASGADILNFAKKIQHLVREKFSIELIPEVNIY